MRKLLSRLIRALAARPVMPTTNDEIERLRAELNRVRAWGERYRDRHDQVAKDLSAERVKTMKLAELRCWTNEDGKRFIFVEDIQRALDIPVDSSVAVGDAR